MSAEPPTKRMRPDAPVRTPIEPRRPEGFWSALDVLPTTTGTTDATFKFVTNWLRTKSEPDDERMCREYAEWLPQWTRDQMVHCRTIVNATLTDPQLDSDLVGDAYDVLVRSDESGNYPLASAIWMALMSNEDEDAQTCAQMISVHHQHVTRGGVISEMETILTHRNRQGTSAWDLCVMLAKGHTTRHQVADMLRLPDWCACEDVDLVGRMQNRVQTMSS